MGIFHVSGNVYLDGYWQSEKYFQDISRIIRNEFTLRQILDKDNLEIAQKIISNNSIGIHIRRGDYVRNPIHKKIYENCDPSYYYQCVKFITSKIQNPYLFIFSDETEWVVENIRFDFPSIIISHNGMQKDYVDLYLMSLCHHFVIANSSFSWWAAWLGSHPDKLVFAPKNWFKNSKMNSNDLIPKEWLRI